MKIDTSRIEGYADMSTEDKLKALEGFEYEDNAEELSRQKNAISKANSDAAQWKKKYNDMLSEDERKKQEQADSIAAMQKELDELRTAKTVSEYKAKFVAQGYAEDLADDTAKALAAGDSAKVFANQQKFLDEYAKKVKSDILKGTPTPHGNAGSVGVDYDKKIEEARASKNYAEIAYYTRLKAQEESANNK